MEYFIIVSVSRDQNQLRYLNTDHCLLFLKPMVYC